MKFLRPPQGSLSVSRSVVFLAVLAYSSLSYAQYADSVLEDEPFAYWRLNDAPGSPENLGLENIVANYTAAAITGGPSLIDRANGTTASTYFDGVSGRVNINDSDFINSTGPFLDKTIELWFAADNAQTQTPQVIYEQGGSTRGMNVYVHNGNVVVGAWNAADDDGGTSSPWPGGTVAANNPEGIFLSAPIESYTPYHVAIVMTGDSGGFGGTQIGYLNGEKFAEQDGVGTLFAHTDDIAIGGVRGESLFPEHVVGTAADNRFVGAVSDVALYNAPLSGDRIKAHFDNSVPLQTPVGDFDLNGILDLADFAILADHFNTQGGYLQGNMNFDLQVDIEDFLLWRAEFSAPQGALAAVPEPGSAILMLLGGFALLRLKRR